MSGEKCHSLDRLHRRQQRSSFFPSSVYIPEKAANRLLLKSYSSGETGHIPSTPNIHLRSYGGANKSKNLEHLPDYDNIELLENFEAPNVYNLPPDSSFDEVRCIMATPPHAAPKAAQRLNEVVADVSHLNDLRKRMATHIGLSEIDTQDLTEHIDNVRKRITAVIAETDSEPPFRQYKMLPLPEDLQEIPPPPKNKKDVAAIIRRAQAIARFKALKEKKAALEQLKSKSKASDRSLAVAPKQESILFKSKATFSKPSYRVPTIPQQKSGQPISKITALQKPKHISATELVKRDKPKKTSIVAKKDSQLLKPHPSDYIPDTWAAAILRARNHAGLKTTNAKLLPKRKAKLVPPAAKLFSRLPSPPLSKTPTFSNIMKRISVLRSAANVHKAVHDKRKRDVFARPQNESQELDEFEALEELYGAVRPDHCLPTQRSISNLQNRINVLQQHLLKSPIAVDSLAEELDEFETLEQQFGAAPYSEHPAQEQFLNNLQDRINSLKKNIFQSPISDQEPVNTQKSSSPRRFPSSNEPHSQKFDSFKIGEDVSLGKISMPDFDQDISFNEVGLADLTSPDLCNLSISADSLALEPDFPSKISTEEVVDNMVSQKVTEKIPEQSGLLTAVVSAIVDSFKNIFSPSKVANVQNFEQESELEIDTSLPNMFEATQAKSPTSKTPKTSSKSGLPVLQKPETQNPTIVIPPHPTDPKDYKAMVKRSQAIQNKKMEECAADEVHASFSKKKRMREKEIASSIQKDALPTKKVAILTNRKGEKSEKMYPSGENPTFYAKARFLPGLRNLSAALNPEREARIDEFKASRKARLTAIETLPPIERLREKLKIVRRGMGGIPTPSIEALATLEAIRLSLPRSKALTSTEDTHKKENSKNLSVMSPVLKDSKLKRDFIQFSPLKPHEGRMRLRFLKEQAARHEQAAKFAKRKETFPSLSASPIIRPILPMRLSPIRLHSPIIPRTEETIQKKIAKNSKIKNVEVSTPARQSTTKTDHYRNVIYQVKKGNALSEGDKLVSENLADIEEPDFFDLSDLPPRDPSIPTLNKINRIQSEVKDKLSYAFPDVKKSYPTPRTIYLPQELTDEDIFGIEKPEFEITPQKTSPYVKSASSIDKDQRMYAWGEHPAATTPTKVPTINKTVKYVCPISKTKSPEAIICVPPHPKDPKNYKALIQRAQAIQKLKKQQERWEHTPQNISKRKQLALKKRFPKIPVKKIEQPKDYDDMVCPIEPLALSKKYREAVARARLLHGLENKTAALNPAIAAKIAAKKAAKADYNALSDIEKLKLKLEELRKHFSKKRHIKPSAELLGTLDEFPSSPTPKAKPQTEIQQSETIRVTLIPDDLRQDFRVPAAKIVMETSQLMPETAPRNIQFKDLESMPFDDLENEIEPSLTNISLEVPLSPPPTPSEIINTIKSKLRLEIQRSPLLLPTMLKLPKEFPDENLLELSLPHFTQTPPETPLKKNKSPRVSLPMAWGETRIASLGTTENQPIKKTSSLPLQDVIGEKTYTADDEIVIPPHPKDPKDYATMIRRARAIYKLNKQKKKEKAVLALPLSKTHHKDCILISKLKGLLPRKTIAKQITRLVQEKEKEQREYPTEPPPLPKVYRDAVAKSRLLHGLKNRTAALNPKVAARNAAKKAAREAKLAPYSALSEIDKIKVRMERLRRNNHRKRHIKPTMEQIAYLEALKQMNEYQMFCPEILSKSQSQLPLNEARLRSRPLSISPRADLKLNSDDESRALAEFETLEQFHKSSPLTAQDFYLKQHSVLLEKENISQSKNVSLTEYENLETPHIQQDAQPLISLNIKKLISELRKNQLATPPHLRPEERFRQLIAQRKIPTIPVESPLNTPEVCYTPITLLSSPERCDNVIEEQAIDTSEIVDEKSQRFRITTDPQGNVKNKINERKHVTARDRLTEIESAENLGNIEEPSYLDITFSTPMEQPSHRDIIERIRAQLNERYKQKVPTGLLVELRTPPRMLPLPTGLQEQELLNLSFPKFEITPLPSPTRHSLRTPDISLPQLFEVSPQPPTPTIPVVSPLNFRVQPPQSPFVIPTHLKDCKDYKSMVKRARKIQQLIEQNKAQERATKEAEESALLKEVAKSKKTERVPVSRWTPLPPTKQEKRKKLVLKKRDKVMPTRISVRSADECPAEPPPRPEHFVKEVAIARKLAGLVNRTAAINPEISVREATKKEAIRRSKVAKAARLTAISAAQRSPIRNYAEVLSKMKELRNKGASVRREPSLAAAAYLNALKGAMLARHDQQQIFDSPKTRYERILAERTILPPAFEESPFKTVSFEDIYYSPIRFVSPYIGDTQTASAKSIKRHNLDLAAFQSLDELDELCEIEQPSYVDISQYEKTDHGYLPVTSPQTPPPESSVIINRIRKQYEKNNALTFQQKLLPTPGPLEFPKELPEEQLFDHSAPSFTETPIKSQTPVMSPNISIPLYFEENLPLKESLQRQRRERTRNLNELERLQQTQGLEHPALKSSNPTLDRLEAIKSKIAAQTPNSSAFPCSPIKTPEAVDFPQFQPLTLPRTPPYPFLDNVSIDDIASVSMQLDELDNYETTDEEDLEFQIAEIANAAYVFGENHPCAELDRTEDNYNLAGRIQMLQQQLLESSDGVVPDILEEYNLAKRMEILKKQLLSTPTQYDSYDEEAAKGVCAEILSDDEEFNQQDVYDDIGDFKLMERECL